VVIDPANAWAEWRTRAPSRIASGRSGSRIVSPSHSVEACSITFSSSADVARIRVAHEEMHRARRNAAHALGVPLGGLANEVRDQLLEIARPALTQRGERNRDHGEAIVEVLAIQAALTRSSRTRLVAAITRTSTGICELPPTGITVLS
jgi:hypothetical protein